MTTADQRRKRSWRRHLQGWQVGAFIVGLAVVAASLALPRATAPFVLPLPAHDAALARTADQAELSRAAEARAEPLPHSIRLVGEAVRRLGAATVERPSDARRLQRDLVRDVHRHVAQGRAEALLTLRALQSDLFVEAARSWEQSSVVSVEMRELGGDFPEAAAAWRKGGAAPDGRAAGPLVLTDQELRLLFRVRWGLLTETHRVHPFGPSLDEFRQYYGLLLTHPTGTSAQDRLLAQLAAVNALGRIDSAYPASFARGVLHGRLGDLQAAAEAFADYGRAHQDGPWLLLARNHWLAMRAHLN